jgi:large subunit ribosomal protein L4e
MAKETKEHETKEKETTEHKKEAIKAKKTPRKHGKKEKAPEGKVHIYNIHGESKKTVELPEIFETPIRPDLIHRDVVAAQANRRQPYGSMPRAGMRHSVYWWGKGRGVSRVPRLKDGRTGAQSPGCVGGRRAWPPLVERIWHKKVNKKERLLARRSAISAIKDLILCKARGHKFADNLSLPIIVEDKFEEVDTTHEVLDILHDLGVYDDIARAKDGIKVRAGRGKMRGRRFRRPKSLLIIVKDRKGLERGAHNLPGVDLCTVSQLNTELLAPGGVPGRLTIISEGALKSLGNLGKKEA